MNCKFDKEGIFHEDDAPIQPLIKKTIKDLQINSEQFKPGPAGETISRAKDELIDCHAYQAQAQGSGVCRNRPFS